MARKRFVKVRIRFAGESRNFQDPRYTAWRKAVRARDHNECRKCGKSPGVKNIVCHHIRRWADHPMLRFVVSNGVTLCRKCHKLVTGNENVWIPFFINAVNNPPKRDWMGHLEKMREGKSHFKPKYKAKPMTDAKKKELNKKWTEVLRKKREDDARNKLDGGEGEKSTLD